jgi:phenylpyruvate tautomerase PptA (4-oxalocrotonate tautomerase family)
MPFVNVKVIEGVFSAAQKQDIVRKVLTPWSRSRVRTCAR